jgi:GMP synthase-like glutamine amidotransferase
MILIISLCTKKHPVFFDEFVKPIADCITEPHEVAHYTEKFDSEKYSKIILCGTALKDDEYLKHLDKFEWLKDTKKPVLGICAGMQVIARVNGAEIHEAKEIGFTNISSDHVLLKNTKEVYCLHHLAVECPKGFKKIAESDICLQSIQKDKIIGLLFHPEVNNKHLIRTFIEQ